MTDPSPSHFLLYVVLIIVTMEVLRRVDARRVRVARARRARRPRHASRRRPIVLFGPHESRVGPNPTKVG